MPAQTHPIRIDLSDFFAEHVTAKQLQKARPEGKRALKALEKDEKAGRMDFTKLPDDKKLLDASVKLARKMKSGVTDVVICGIGGSSLGFLAVAEALLHPRHNALPDSKRKVPRFHLLDNADADTVAAVLDIINPSKTLVVVISKSGSGGETIANFMVVLERLVKHHKGSLPGALKQVVAITDPENGALRRFVNEHKVASLPVPPGVGGRFSVLTPVGIFPAALLGIKVADLLAGAGAMLKRCHRSDPLVNPAMTTALALDLHCKAGRPITVFMPYANSLWRTADWFRQLWAESLGKETDNHG
ncbi:glucose-6-phosphate isomerase, partial [bacterium]|nr:glucose-6-phosphate isomerase [bacterium]